MNKDAIKQRVLERIEENKQRAEVEREKHRFRDEAISNNVCPDCGESLSVNKGFIHDYIKRCKIHGVILRGMWSLP